MGGTECGYPRERGCTEGLLGKSCDFQLLLTVNLSQPRRRGSNSHDPLLAWFLAGAPYWPARLEARKQGSPGILSTQPCALQGRVKKGKEECGRTEGRWGAHTFNKINGTSLKQCLTPGSYRRLLSVSKMFSYILSYLYQDPNTDSSVCIS